MTRFSTLATLAFGFGALSAALPTGALSQELSTYGVLAGSTVTNTGFSVINGNVGLSPGTSITGFPPGAILAPYSEHKTDAAAAEAQSDLTIAYNILQGRTTKPGGDLTDQDLGGLVLTPGVYSFADEAQLTGTLTLDTLGDPNAVFIFNINSTLKTASSSTVTIVGTGGQVFWRVGSSATLGTTSTFIGDILAQASITLTTDANITCGAALARTGAVTLDSNNITSYDVLGCAIAAITAGSALDLTATENERAVADAIDAYVNGGGTLPLGFQILAGTLTPDELAAALSQLSGETGTAVAPAGTGSMNSFLSLVLGSGFGETRSGPAVVNTPAPANIPATPKTAPVTTPKGTVKALGYLEDDDSSSGSDLAWAALDRVRDTRPWNMWAAVYGGYNATGGDASVGSHDASASTYGVAAGLDFRVTPDMGVGFAVAGGGTSFGLAEGYGSGSSGMVQTALYARQEFRSAYIAAALAYAWHGVSTDRTVTVGGADRFSAAFSAHNVAGEIEAGYRMGMFTPYAAVQLQAFYTPAYSEDTVSGSSLFALSYAAKTTTTARTEVGLKFDRTLARPSGRDLLLHARLAWVHDYWSDRNVTAMFQSLPGSSFVVKGAVPAADSVLVSAGSELWLTRSFSIAGSVDGQFNQNAQTYGGNLKLRHVW